MARLSALDVAVDAVAVARLTKLVQDDEVPFGPARDWLLERYGDRKAADLLSCPWCLSVHLAALAVLARHLFPRPWGVLARVLVGSAVAGHLAELSERTTR